MDKTYKCRECGKDYPIDSNLYLCPDCGSDWKPGEPLKGVLTVDFNYSQLRNEFMKTLDFNVFSAIEPIYFPNYPIGNTPFFRSDTLSDSHKNLFIKFEGLNPSGSLKDRASFLVVADAIRRGEKEIVCASTGNAASALAAVCASAGIKAKIFVPSSAPVAKIIQMEVCGADVVKVNGTYDDAFTLSVEYSKKTGIMNRNTAYNPLTIEGKKSVSIELFEQNGCNVPDYIFVPVGDGVIISGIYKGFTDLLKAGISEKMPKLICVQAEGSDAVHNYIVNGKYSDCSNPYTKADSISVKCPSNVYMAKEAVVNTHGFSILVSDEEISKAQQIVAQKTGIFCEPAAAAAAAGFFKSSDQIPVDAQIVLLLTGHGLKNIESLMVS